MLSIKKAILLSTLVLFVLYPIFSQEGVATKAREKNKSTWQYLIKDNSTEGWHKYLGGTPEGWQVKEGVLFTLGKGGDIVTNEQYENFELSLEWKLEEKGNSGVFYYVVESPENKRIYETGPEFQIIDDINYPQELTEQQKTGALSDVIAPRKAQVKPIGQWNLTRIVSNKGKVEHWLNGRLILKYQLGSAELQQQIAASKFANLPFYAKARVGRIGLQDHGDPIYYRNIKIRRL